MNFADRLNIPPSPTLAMNAAANKKRAAGERVFNLSAGEPIIPTPQPIVDAATEALKNEKTFYTPSTGIAPLRSAVSSWMNNSYGTDFSAEQTFVTNGGKYALFALCQTLLNPGDEALVVTPFWVSYPSMVRLASATPTFIETRVEDGWKMTPEMLSSAAAEKTTLLFLNNGSNPTGVLYTKEELEAILKVAKEKNVLVISDEVYSTLTYDDREYTSAASFPEYRDSVVVVQSCSKAFSMTGWRVGFVFGDESLIKKLGALQGQSTSNTNSIGQWAAVAAYEYANELTGPIRDTLESRRNLFAKTWKELFGNDLTLPASSLYMFVPLHACGTNETDDVAFCTNMLEQGSVATVPGTPFGAAGFIRLSFGIEEDEIVAALTQLHKTVSQGE